VPFTFTIHDYGGLTGRYSNCLVDLALKARGEISQRLHNENLLHPAMLEKTMLPKWAVFLLAPEIFLVLKTPRKGISACLSLVISPQSIPLAALTGNSIPN
jgi:hypothetical protein